MVAASASHLTPFDVGQISALSREGYAQREIADLVYRADGSNVSFGAVGRALRRLKAQPSWTGERSVGSGRQRATSPAADKELVRAAFDNRGKTKTTAVKLQKIAPAFKKTSTKLVRRRLREHGLNWLRRRRKTLVPPLSVQARMVWAHWVKRQSVAYLQRFVCADGVIFYLDRTEADLASTQRAALGLYVWRQTEQQDALYKDCIGPSSYAKSQGAPVRVWGLLEGGRLHIHVLPPKTPMNRWIYEQTIRQCFKQWLKRFRNPILVQDHERCLWCQEPLAAFRDCGIEVCDKHPKHSPDLNAIENAWFHLRARLNATVGGGKEQRSPFIRRLHRAVKWLNKNKRKTLLSLSRNQKRRAADVLANEGQRTKW